MRISRTRLSWVPAAGSTSATSSLTVLVPQSTAATRVTRRSGAVAQGPDRQKSPSASSTSSPSGFTPRPCASAWPASTCRHFTRVGMPPAETPAISGTSPIASR